MRRIRAMRAAVSAGVTTVAVAGAALIAAPPASALTASIPISPFVVWYPRSGNVGNSNYPQGNFTNNIKAERKSAVSRA